MSPTLQDRRASLTDEIDALTTKQGAALLDGEPFDASALHAKETELSALTAAEIEASRRDLVAAGQRLQFALCPAADGLDAVEHGLVGRGCLRSRVSTAETTYPS
jgi:hypothetical protein